MATKDLLTENEVIEGVKNYLEQKGNTTQKRLIRKSDAGKKERGVDLVFKLENDKHNGNWYFIEAKGNKRSDGGMMRSAFNTNFRWAISQIILRIHVDSRRNNYIYGIAVPDSEIDDCKKLICKNWALKNLKIRLYGAFYDVSANKLMAKEYLPRDLYK